MLEKQPRRQSPPVAPGERNSAKQAFPHVLRKFPGHIGIDKTRCHGVHRNSTGSELLAADLVRPMTPALAAT